jgi:hypothetical protein
VLKKIRSLAIKLQIKELIGNERAINQFRAKLVHRPPLDEIPERLDRIEGISKELKKIKKKKKKLYKLLESLRA